MSRISVQNLTFAYDGSDQNIFENVSFQIDTDWKLGFTGRNGRGKTTFMRLLQGWYEYSGKIAAAVNFEYFPYEVKDGARLTADVVMEASGGCESWELERELSLLGVPDDALTRPFNTLSSGERTKALLAGLFLKESAFLLIDEPTNHLDIEARRVVGEYLRGKRGFILVSHDRAFLDNCVDHILSINRTDIEVRQGNFSTYMANKERQDSFELAENQKLQKDIKRLKQAARQSDKWADSAETKKLGRGSAGVEKCADSMAYYGEKSRRMQQRRLNLERRQEHALEEKSGLLRNIETAEALKISPLAHHARRLVEADKLAISYGGLQICSGVGFTVEQGDRIALTGRNGSGKSSLLKLICGEDIDHTGKLFIASQLVVSYVPQDTAGLSGSLFEYARSYGIEESLFLAILSKLDFPRAQFERDIGDFSEGQKKKTLIARSLCERAHLYIWDEPLNYIDIYSRMQIEELLLKYGPTVIFVEHDGAFCDKIATKRAEITR